MSIKKVYLYFAFVNASNNCIFSTIYLGGGKALSVVSVYGHGSVNIFLSKTIDVYSTVGMHMSGQGNQIISKIIKIKPQPAILFYENSSPQNISLINYRLFSGLQNSPSSRKSTVVLHDHDKNFVAKSNAKYYVAGEAFPKSAPIKFYKLNEIYKS